MFMAFSPDAGSDVVETAAETAVPAIDSEYPGDYEDATDAPAAEETAAVDPAEGDDETDTDLEEATAETEVVPGDESHLDATTVNLAKRMGLSDDDLAAFADTQDLQRHLTLLDRTTLSRTRQQSAAQVTPAPTEATKPPAAGDEKPAQEQPAATSTVERLKLDLDPEVWDEHGIKTFNQINDHYAGVSEKLAADNAKLAGELEQIKQTLGGFQQQEQARQAAQAESQLDGWFDSIGADYAETFGAGPMAKIDPSSPLAKNRMDLVAEATALAQADASLGRSPSTPQELLQRALGARFHSQTKTQARSEIAREVAQRRQQGVARPASRAKPQSRDDKAAQTAVNFFRDRGLNDDDGDLDEV